MERATAVARLDKELCGITRIVLLVMREPFCVGNGAPWRTADVYDVACPLDGGGALRTVASAVQYAFREDDRLATAPGPGGARYVEGGLKSVLLGQAIPPSIAAAAGIELDAAGLAVRVVGATAARAAALPATALIGGACLAPPGAAHLPAWRMRWATPDGPFALGELPIEALFLSDLIFARPTGWPKEWRTMTALVQVATAVYRS